jgi:flavin-dependent dehydrogenase
MPETLQRDKVCDIAIIGGGPAGAAAALSAKRLRPHLRVVMVASRPYTTRRAAETLSPGCQEILCGLGCWDSFRNEGFTESPGTRAVWGGPEPYDNDFLFSLRGNGWHVDRTRFDALLRNSARQNGAEVIEDAWLRDVQRQNDSFSLGLRSRNSRNGSEAFNTLRAQFVIDASGRQASFASKCGARPLPDDRLIGVCGVLAAANSDATTLVEAQSDGWWYSSLVPGSRVMAAWMSDADLVRKQELCNPDRWMAHLHSSKWMDKRICGALLGPLRIWTAHSQRLSQAQGQGWVAAGDAATTYDPLSSLGILKALRTGKVASFVAVDALEGRDSAGRYAEWIIGEYTSYRHTKHWFYSQEQRWRQSPFWQRRVNGDD